MSTSDATKARSSLQVGPTSEFSLFFRVKPGQAENLRAALRQLQDTPGYRPGDYGMAIATIHEARFVLFDDHRQLEAPRGPYGWQDWSFGWPATEVGRHSLRARATDAAGNVQPEVPPWNRLGHGNNAIEVSMSTSADTACSHGRQRELRTSRREPTE